MTPEGELLLKVFTLVMLSIIGALVLWGCRGR